MRFKVDNAIIMAAGMASRFVPLSYEVPKGLLRVKGEVLVERQIRQLHEVGVSDITVVVGYMAEKFEYLRTKFGVELIYNPDYNRYNNSATLMCVLDKLHNTYICSSDNYFTENVFETCVEDSYYAAVFYPGASNEWGLVTDDAGYITAIDHSPVDMWCMMGHVFFSEEFSAAFSQILKNEFKKESVRLGYWENVFEDNLPKLRMNVRKYKASDIKEFDSLEDLRQFDRSYLNDTGSVIFKNIGAELDCDDKDIEDVCAVKNGLMADSFTFVCRGKKYIYSHGDKSIEEIL